MPRRLKRVLRNQTVVALERRNLAMGAAQATRRLILDGRFPPGSHIVEAELVAVLKVSHGTIRAALHRLRHEGLVEYRPNRGIFVRGLSARDAWEVYTLRNTLEAQAARLAAERVTEEARQELRAIFDCMRKAVGAGNRQQAIRADFDFHRTVMRLAGHRLLQEHYDVLELQTRLFITLTEGFHPDLSHFVPHHEPLVDAITAGDAARAEMLAAHHNDADGEELLKYLERMNPAAAAVSSE